MPKRLVLFHLSDRYVAEEWKQQLEDVGGAFPQTYFPESWQFQKDRNDAWRQRRAERR